MNRRALRGITLLAAAALGASLQTAPSTATAAADAKLPQPPAGSARTLVGYWVGGVAPDCLQGGCPRGDVPKGTWAALRESDAFLNVGLTYGVDYGPGADHAVDAEAVRFVRKARQEGVEVSAWLLGDIAAGTFAHESNAPVMRKAVKAFVAWKQNHHLGIGEAILDLEFPSGSQATSLPELQAGIDPAHQCGAIRIYRDTLRWSRTHGLRLSGSPVPFGLDDLANGDMALADALNLAPLIEGYDRLYLQAYRTYSDAGPDYVSGYLLDLRERFGRAAEITLGDTTMAAPYSTVGPLASDLRLLAGLGATRVPVFNLSGSLSKYGVAGLRQLGRAARRPMSPAEIKAATAPNPLTTSTRGFFTGLDLAASTAAIPAGANSSDPAC